MEDKMMNMLEQLYIEVKTINKRLDNMDSDMKDLKQGQARTEERLIRIEAKVDTIDSKLDTVEVHNASRHVELNGKLEKLSKDVALIEAVTGKNMTDIAFIKAVK